MKSICILVTVFLPFAAESMEHCIECENDEVRVSKIVLMPGEKVGLHRDETPRVVIGIKGGTYTRIEEDGSKKEILFPTGKSIYLGADPVGKMHTGVNGKTELEIIVVELKTKTS